MNSFAMPTDQDLARERVDAALRDYNFCSTCSRPMTIQERGSELWIECASLHGLRGIRFRIAAGLHDRHALDLPSGEVMPAAA